MKFTNLQMEQMIKALEPHLDRTDVIGFAVIRNTRLFEDALQEFRQRKNDLVVKYGEPVEEDGEPTDKVTISPESERWQEFCQELDTWANIEVEVPVHTLTWEQVAGKIPGKEILNIDWMVE